MAATGQMLVCVAPRATTAPFRSWSVFEAFMLSCMWGGCPSATYVTSLMVRCTDGSNLVASGTKNSLHRRKPKKPTQQTAHIIRLPKVCGSLASSCFKWLIMLMVIGSRTRGWFPVAFVRAIPRRRRFM